MKTIVCRWGERKALLPALLALFLALTAILPGVLAEAPGEDGAIQRFWFTRGGYMAPQSYELLLLDGEYYLWLSGNGGRRIDGGAVEKLQSALMEWDIASWDGFSKNDPFVLDGEGFSLAIEYSDGTAVSASGENAFPPHYFDLIDCLYALFGDPWDAAPLDAEGVYRFEGEGPAETFLLTLNADGTYTAQGEDWQDAGDWSRGGARLYLSGAQEPWLYNCFLPVEDTLVFLAAESEGFPPVTVPDRGRLRRLSPAELIANGAEALTVGPHLPLGAVTEFYYTCDSSAFPPEYQRYRFFTEEGNYWFFHETRSGDHWPLTEADAAAAGTVELTRQEWLYFLASLRGGTVRQRSEEVLDGDAGPWLYLYWQGDPGEHQEFSFASRQMREAFERFCRELVARDAAE